jgi:hypothetical protein
MALPVLLARFPPGADLANHFLEVSLMRNFDNAAMFPLGLYQRSYALANQLFYFIAYALSFAAPLVVAFRATVALGVVLTALGVARLARHLGKSMWTLCAIMPMVFGFSFYWGFASWNLAVGLFLGALPEADAFAQQPTWKGLARVLAIMLVLFATHEQAMILYAGASALFALGHLRPAKAFVVRGVPFLAGVAGSVAFHTLMEQKRQALAISAAKPLFLSLRDRLINLPDSLFGSTQAPRTLLGLYMATVVIFIANALARRQWRRSNGSGSSGFLREWRFELLAASFLVLHLFGPNSLNGANYLADRLQQLAWVVGIIAVAPRRLPRLLGALEALMIPLSLAASLPSFLISHEQYSDLDTLLEHVRPGSAIAQLELDSSSETHAFSFMGGDAYMAARQGARSMNSFAYSPIAPVTFVPEFHWVSPMQRLPSASMLFAPGFDLTAFRYVLLKTESLLKAQAVARLLEPEAHLVAHLGWWTLLESNLRVRPPKMRLGTPPYCPEFLSDRLFDRKAFVLEPSWIREGEAANHCSDAPHTPEELEAIRALQKESRK